MVQQELQAQQVIGHGRSVQGRLPEDVRLVRIGTKSFQEVPDDLRSSVGAGIVQQGPSAFRIALVHINGARPGSKEGQVPRIYRGYRFGERGEVAHGGELVVSLPQN